MILNYQNLLKMILKIVIVIKIKSESTCQMFEKLRLHTLKSLQKCVFANYTLKNTLQIFKFLIMYLVQYLK